MGSKVADDETLALGLLKERFGVGENAPEVEIAALLDTGSGVVVDDFI